MGNCLDKYENDMPAFLHLRFLLLPAVSGIKLMAIHSIFAGEALDSVKL